MVPLSFKHPARGRQPFKGEAVIIRETAELVPMIVDPVHFGLVGAGEFAAQLHVVGRVGEDQVGTAFRQRIHAGDAIAFDDLIQFQDALPPEYQQRDSQ